MIVSSSDYDEMTKGSNDKLKALGNATFLVLPDRIYEEVWKLAEAVKVWGKKGVSEA